MLRTIGVGMAIGALGFALSAPAPAQDALLEIHFAGLDGFETSDKDAASMGALRLLGTRLADLERELDLGPEQGDLITLAWDMLSGATSLRVEMTEEAPGIGVALSSRPMREGGGAALRDRLMEMAQASGMPFDRDDAGGALFETPMGPASLQVDGQGDASRTTLTMGRIEPAGLEVRSLGLPDGATPIFSMRADMAGISAMLLPMMEMQDPMVAEALQRSGWLGPEAPTIESAIGLTDDAMWSVSRMINARAAMAASGFGSAAVFTAEDLRAAPADTVRLIAMPFTFESTVRSIDEAIGEAMIEQIGDELGVDLRGDVLLNIGPRVLVYQSDSTGGGGLLSTVLVAEVRDPEAFLAAHGRMVERANALAASEARGYARIAARDRGGVRVFTLETPGLPMPLELSWTVAAGRLVVAASPASLAAALSQLGQDGPSVLNNPLFDRAVGGMLPASGATSVHFSDTERHARRGYGIASMLTSALSNGVRSPSEPDRVDSTLMPTFAEFVEGVRPYGSVSVWEGDDFVTRIAADRSALVLLASGAASLMEAQALAGPALAAGAVLPAIGQARESAKRVKSMSQIRVVMQGVIVYGSDRDETMPASFDELIEEGLITRDMLESPYGPAPDGGPDIAVWFDLPGERAFSFDANQIVAIDRAMLLAGGFEINVGFADSHVETLDLWELEEYLAMPINEGAREALGLGDF